MKKIIKEKMLKVLAAILALMMLSTLLCAMGEDVADTPDIVDAGEPAPAAGDIADEASGNAAESAQGQEAGEAAEPASGEATEDAPESAPAVLGAAPSEEPSEAPSEEPAEAPVEAPAAQPEAFAGSVRIVCANTEEIYVGDTVTLKIAEVNANAAYTVC